MEDETSSIQDDSPVADYPVGEITTSQHNFVTLYPRRGTQIEYHSSNRSSFDTDNDIDIIVDPASKKSSDISKLDLRPEPTFASFSALKNEITEQMKAFTCLSNYYCRLAKVDKTASRQLRECFSSLADEDSTIQRLQNRNDKGLVNGEANGAAKRLAHPSDFTASASQLMLQLMGTQKAIAQLSFNRHRFHKHISVKQLDSVTKILYRLQTLTYDYEKALEAKKSQCDAELQEYERKYRKYAESVAYRRGRLNAARIKDPTTSRKSTVAASRSLELATQHLYHIHNLYLLTLATARRFDRYASTRLRPYLLRVVARCLKQIGFAVFHFLRLTTRGAASGDLDWVLREDLPHLFNDKQGLDQEDEALQPVYAGEFVVADELFRISGDPELRPDQLKANHLTFSQLKALLDARRETANVYERILHRLSDERERWKNSLTHWESVITAGCGLPSAACNMKEELALPLLVQLAARDLGPEEISTLIDRVSAVGAGATLHVDLFHQTAVQPAAFGDMAVCLVTVEFDSCLYRGLTEIHDRVLQLGQTVQLPLNSASMPLLTAGNSSDTINAPFNELYMLPRNIEGQFHQTVERKTTEPPADTVTISAVDRNRRSVSTISHQDCDDCSVVGVRASPLDNFTYSIKQPINGGKEGMWDFVAHGLSSFKSGINSAFSRHNGQQVRDRSLKLHPVMVRSNLFTNGSDRDADSPSTVVDSTVTGTTVGELQPPFSGPLESSRLPRNLSHSTIPSIPTDSPRSVTPIDAPTSVVTDVTKEPWFHGVLPRSEIQHLLRHNGDFLVRQTRKQSNTDPQLFSDIDAAGHHIDSTFMRPENANDSRTNRRSVTVVSKMVLSVYWNSHRHFMLDGGSLNDGTLRECWYLSDFKFSSIRELINHYMETGLQLTSHSGARLITPIARPNWQLDNRDVELIQQIGQGNFGNVYRGICNGHVVAVKTCRADPSQLDLSRKFLEGETAALNFCHSNIVQLIGIAARTHPIMIVMEYVAGGSLLNYLRKRTSNLQEAQLLSFCYDASKGMSYLASHKCIHRDLAARNCLLTETGTLKIADFGMAREANSYEHQDIFGQIPIKWTAPEALAHGRYSLKSDVWSYGILLFEVFSGGDTPYSDWSNCHTRKMVSEGFILPPPSRTPEWIARIMRDCFAKVPDMRPSFGIIVDSFSRHISSGKPSHSKRKGTRRKASHHRSRHSIRLAEAECSD